MTTHTIPPGNRTRHLTDAIERASDGDQIIVESEAAAELVRRSLARMRPDLYITITVQPTDPFS